MPKAAKKNNLKIFWLFCTLYCLGIYLCISQNKKANIMEAVIFIGGIITLISIIIRFVSTGKTGHNTHNDVY